MFRSVVPREKQMRPNPWMPTLIAFCLVTGPMRLSTCCKKMAIPPGPAASWSVPPQNEFL